MILNAQQAMSLAFQEAKKGVGWVEPNPPVGCVILDSHNHLLAKGYHKKYGADHAEVSALKKIKDKVTLKKAKVFVTLEPCHHQGKTPSCAEALAQFPLHSLCYGADDPFTHGRGLNYLREKKIKINKSTHFQQELENLIAPFKFSFLNKRAFVSLKVAMSLDGRMALSNGESRWITGRRAREHVHGLRAQHSAVLVGVNTLLKDNPRLNIRHIFNKNSYGSSDKKKQVVRPISNHQSFKTNKIIILDPEGKSLAFLHRSALLKVHPADHIILCCDEKILKDTSIHQDHGVKIKTFKTEYKNYEEVLSSYGGRPKSVKLSSLGEAINKSSFKKRVFFLPWVLKALYQDENISSILVEGGSVTLSQFLWQRSAQRLYLYMAPRVIGQGLSWSGDFVIPKLSQSLELRAVEWDCLGEDFFLSGFLK